MPLNFNNTEIAFSSKKNAALRRAQLLFASMGKPWLVNIGVAITQFAFEYKLPIKSIIKKTIFKQFCGGETLVEADITSKELNTYGIHVIMDYGVEGKSNEDEFEKVTASFLQTIEFAKDKPYIPFISLKVTGFARFELLEKIHAEKQLTQEEENEAQRVFQRIDKICNAAARQNKMILIDAEESWVQQPVDDLADSMMEKYNKEKVVIFNTFQLYRHDRLDFLKRSFQTAQQKKYLLGAKLVRGAYMEKERARAATLNYIDPIQATKEATDRDYNLALAFCLANISSIGLFIGTHNEASCLLSTEIMTQGNIRPEHAHIYFSQLFGMSDNISFNLAKYGYNVSKYLPYGPVEDVIPYLMRRARENTSVAGQTGRELSLINNELKRRRT